MSKPDDILTAMTAQFKTASGLSYISAYYKGEDEREAEDFKKFPFIILDIRDLRVTDADIISVKQMERHNYPVVITGAARHKNKKTVKFGNSSFKGIWDIYEDLITAIKTDRSFGGEVAEAPIQPEFSSVVEKNIDGGDWISRFILIFEVYTDNPQK